MKIKDLSVSIFLLFLFSLAPKDFGDLAGTSSHEITCGISSRVPRVYK